MIKPTIYTEPNKFNEIMGSLATFRDPWNPSTARIEFFRFNNSNTYSIRLTQKPKSFFRKLCEIFYKPEHLRVRKVIEKTVTFLEENKSLLMNAESLQHLINFRSRVIGSSSLNRKVGSATVQRLNALVNLIESTLDLKEKEALQAAEKEAESLLLAANSAKKLKEQELADIQAANNKHIKALEKNIAAVKTDTFDIDLALETRHREISTYSYFFRFEPKHNFDLKVGKGTEDLFFKFYGAIFKAHSILFPSLINDLKAKKTGKSYEINLDSILPTSTSYGTFTDFLDFYYGNRGQVYQIHEIVSLYLIAKILKLDEFAAEIRTTLYEAIFLKDPIPNVCFSVLLRSDTQQLFLKGDKQFLSFITKTIYSFSEEQFKEVSIDIIKEVAKFFETLKSDPYCGPASGVLEQLVKFKLI